MPASYYIGRVQESLVAHGAIGIQMMYDGERRISALSFGLKHKDKKIAFKLPCEWRKFQRVLEIQEIKRWDEDEFAYRVAWANIMDWVLAQMALYETDIVEMPQIFLPFAEGSDGRTLYEQLEEKQFLLGNGKEE